MSSDKKKEKKNQYIFSTCNFVIKVIVFCVYLAWIEKTYSHKNLDVQ